MYCESLALSGLMNSLDFLSRYVPEVSMAIIVINQHAFLMAWSVDIVKQVTT